MSIDKIKNAITQLEAATAHKAEEIEALRLKYLGKKGLLMGLYADLKNIPNEQKKEFGLAVNKLKQAANSKIDELKLKLKQQENAEKAASIDLTLPASFEKLGALHPLTIVRNDVVDVFRRIGFDIAEGPEVVDEWTNFSALNMPDDHPARDMQDTFFVKNIDKHVLRTHTSGVQVQVMMKQKPPIRTISPGMVFRKDNDSTHSPFFHQIEGLYIAEKVSFADLKQTLYYFVQEVFGEGTDFRLRPSYFPFTEPSAEMDIKWTKNESDSWMEILGCGMVDPAVLTNCGIDAEKYSGFAFGIGIERIAMLRYGINDIRTFYENDVRFLQQFITE